MTTKNANTPTLPFYQAATFRGARLSGAGQALPEIWRMLHSNTALIVRFSQADTSRGNGSTLRAVASAEQAIKRDLTSVPADDWAQLCAAAGWTETGAAALSWCKDTTAAYVWAGFQATGIAPSADAAFCRAARLVRPDILPKGATLSGLFGAANGDFYAVCAALVVRRDAVSLDYTDAELASAPPFFLAFLADPAIDLLRPAALSAETD